MKKHGFEVHAASSLGPELAPFGMTEQIPTYSVPLARRITPAQDIRAVVQLREVIRSLRPGIVHAHTPKAGLVAMISAWLARTPVRIYHIRGLPYMTAEGKGRVLLKATERISCALAHRVFCVSHSIREIAIQDGICPPGKIVVFGGGSGNGVDADTRFQPNRFTTEEIRDKRTDLGLPDGAPVVLFVGRIAGDKGVGELARAWKTVRQRYTDARLVLVGASETKDPVQLEVMKDLIEDPRVIMTGFTEDPAWYYSVADLVVLPTYREGFPNVLLEAAAMEVPVVATNVPGCIDAVEDGVTGTLIPPQDSGSLARSISRYLDDPELRRAHGKSGRERVVSDFRQEVIWEAIYQEYCRLLESKGMPAPMAEVSQV